tara:strand:+ start:15978 stop:17234 length:1257 start_codon:yes stop_codon:yes gene_type:complete
MAIDIVVPALGESVTEATVSKWLKKLGDSVSQDEPLCELETDKVAVEIYSPSDGILSEIIAEENTDVEVGGLIGKLSTSIDSIKSNLSTLSNSEKSTNVSNTNEIIENVAKEETNIEPEDLAPSVRKLIEENNLDPQSIVGTGKNGRIIKGDVISYLENVKLDKQEQKSEILSEQGQESYLREPSSTLVERVQMSRLRKRISERLKDAQNTAAILTTFNEVDMTNVIRARNDYKEIFEKKHGVRLGFMSFFVIASIAALREVPAVNAEIDGDDIIYKHYWNIGVAVSTTQGLVVPVIRDANKLDFAGIEKKITDMGNLAQDGKLSIDDMIGGTFTISNGGIFGSMLSTPILNPPQSGILGMHNIQNRPVAVGNEIEIRPMMYLALSYDHRIVDGREAVTFLVRVKECIENPERILFNI